MALVINPFAIVNLSDVIPPAWIFSDDKFPLTNVSILAILESNEVIVPLTAFNSVISAFPINALFIVASAAIKFCMFALIVFKSVILALVAFSSATFAITAFNSDILALLAYKSSILAFTTVKSVILPTLASKSYICSVEIPSIVLPSTVPLSVVILFTVSVVSWNSFCISSKLKVVFAISQVLRSGSSGYSTIFTMRCFSLISFSLDTSVIISPKL